ncbi:MAG: hypothetical protein KF785_00360 [Gemmatimonadales bacterium]|nr:hypothetical protein [Gemmatimonadales bacterium]
MSRPKQGVVVRFCAAGCFLLLACSSGSQSNAADAGDYLYVWTASVDSTQPDFLAVIDLAEDSGRSGRLVTTLPVPGRRNVPHHTEHEMPADRQLFANGFATGQSFIIDLTDPATPKLAAQFGDVAGMSHPHSYLRLPSGNVLTTFQNRHEGNTIAPGGLAEMTPTGQTVRAASAQGPGVHPGTRPYSAVVMPAIDRIVSTTSDMHADSPASAYLQIWRLSDLTLLNTVPLPNGPLGDEALLTAEPRLLPDGKRLLVSTFNCALYLVEDLDRATPTSRLVASFPRMAGEYCAIPVIVGSYYLIAVPAWRAVVSLDISDPAAPREVGRLTLGTNDVPHWIAVSPDQRRVVVTGNAGMRHRVVMARFDPATGTLTLDAGFRNTDQGPAGFSMVGVQWPHGTDAPGVPHGAVFARP